MMTTKKQRKVWGTKSKPHKCPACSRSFATEVRLRYHIGAMRRQDRRHSELCERTD